MRKKPTTAELQRDLAEMTEQRDIYEQSSQEYAQLYEETKEKLDRLLTASKALQSDIARQWPVPSQGEFAAAIKDAEGLL